MGRIFLKQIVSIVSVQEEDARQGAALQAELEGQLAAAVAAAAAWKGRASEAAAEGYKAGLVGAQKEQQQELKHQQQRGGLVG